MNVKHLLIIAAILAALLILTTGFSLVQASPTGPLVATFTYQGRLMLSGVPAGGPYDFEFYLYDHPITGTQVGGPIPINDLVLNDGYFTVLLDFGLNVFSGEKRYLEVHVRPGSDTGSFTTLTPRQELTATPNALFSLRSPWGGLIDVPPGFDDGIDNDTLYTAGAGLVLTGTAFSADPAALQLRVNGTCASGYAIRSVNQNGTVTCEQVAGGGNAWLLTGNIGTSPGANYLGTNDNVALVFKVNSQRVLRLEPNATSPNLIGGYIDNWAYTGAYGAVIGGGGNATDANVATDSYSTIGGGAGNVAGNSDPSTTDVLFATVGGGYHNIASASYSIIGGGYTNTVKATYSTIAGGDGNTIVASNAFIGGGYGNAVNWIGGTVCGGSSNIADSANTVIAGGLSNVASGGQSAIGGGEDNVASGYYATIAGGGPTDFYDPLTSNRATDNYAVIGGGGNNQAGDNDVTLDDAEFATVGGGKSNTASDDYATISGGLDNIASNIRATVSGGITNTASGSESTVGGGQENVAEGIASTVPGGVLNIAAGNYSFAAGRRAWALHQGCFVWGDSSNHDVWCDDDDQWVARADGGFYLYTSWDGASGSLLAPGSGTWADLSDRNMKENVQSVDTQALLEKLAQVPVTTWNYKSQDASIRHMGPMAQDFYATFGIGEDDKHITTVDADGVALAAIQGLYAENQQLEAQVVDLEARLSKLEKSSAATRNNLSLNIPWMLAFGLVTIGSVWVARRQSGGDK